MKEQELFKNVADAITNLFTQDPALGWMRMHRQMENTLNKGDFSALTAENAKYLADVMQTIAESYDKMEKSLKTQAERDEWRRQKKIQGFVNWFGGN